MTRARFRQTARLERLAEAKLSPKTKENVASQLEESVRNHAATRIANLSALILYGDPKIDEPLSFAWERCLESAEWQKRREKYGGWDEYGGDTCGDPFVGYGATRIAKYFRKYFLPDLPGADEVEKFGLIFKRAAPWLLWFTYADASAQMLGIKLPDLSTVNRFVRDPQKFVTDELPPGPFECRLRIDGIDDQIAIIKDWMINQKEKHEATGGTPRERKRIGRIREKYKSVSEPLPEQEVMTRIAVFHLLGRTAYDRIY